MKWSFTLEFHTKDKNSCDSCSLQLESATIVEGRYFILTLRNKGCVVLFETSRAELLSPSLSEKL